jgi:hypothetical protein
VVAAFVTFAACGERVTTTVASLPEGPSVANANGKKLGSISVAAATSGSSLDPDGYSVCVDGASSKTLATNGSVSFPNIDPGSHTVTLTGLAANCTAANNPQTIDVAIGGATSVSFAVTCTALPTPGGVTVTAATTGNDLDPNAYDVVVDNSPTGLTVQFNGSIDVGNLSPGSHAVSLAQAQSQPTAPSRARVPRPWT